MKSENKMRNEIISAKEILKGTSLSIIDMARLVKNALDFKEPSTKLSDMQFCSKVLSCGIKHLHIKEMPVEKGFRKYLATKSHLRPESMKDLKYLTRRLFRNKSYARKNFSELSISDCEKWISGILQPQRNSTKPTQC